MRRLPFRTVDSQSGPGYDAPCQAPSREGAAPDMSTDDDLALVLKAADFAAVKHRDQRRKNGDIPYINHPLGVARILREAGGIRDGATLAAALLHDTVEDTRTSPEELEREFGAKIAGIVAEVTDDKKLPKVERKRLQIKHARVMSAEARLVKLADKIYNLRDLADRPPRSWDLERIQGYFCWAYHVVRSMGEVNSGLQRILDGIFASEFTFGETSYRRLPRVEAERGALLENYLARMEKVADQD